MLANFWQTLRGPLSAVPKPIFANSFIRSLGQIGQISNRQESRVALRLENVNQEDGKKEQCRIECDQTDYISARQIIGNGVYLVQK